MSSHGLKNPGRVSCSVTLMLLNEALQAQSPMVITLTFLLTIGEKALVYFFRCILSFNECLFRPKGHRQGDKNSINLGSLILL